MGAINEKSAGELTLQEQLELHQLIQQQDAAQAYAAFFNDLIATTTHYASVSDTETDSFIREVHKKINKKRSRLVSVNWKIASAVAASLLMIAASLLYFSNRPVRNIAPNIVATKKGNKTNIVLPDGTKVWINADSRLTYEQSFGKKTREVELSGEAFFDVTHDPDRPFIVHTRNIDVRVFGTAFNVRCYADDSSAQTTLIRGSVQVCLKHAKDKKIMLEPNEKLVVQNTYSQQGKDSGLPDQPQIELLTAPFSAADSSVAETQWVNNKLVFKKEYLENIIPELERWYNVKIVLRNKNNTRTFSGTFDNDALEDVLQSLKLSAGIKYKIEKGIVIIY